MDVYPPSDTTLRLDGVKSRPQGSLIQSGDSRSGSDHQRTHTGRSCVRPTGNVPPQEVSLWGNIMKSEVTWIPVPRRLFSALDPESLVEDAFAPSDWSSATLDPPFAAPDTGIFKAKVSEASPYSDATSGYSAVREPKEDPDGLNAQRSSSTLAEELRRASPSNGMEDDIRPLSNILADLDIDEAA